MRIAKIEFSPSRQALRDSELDKLLQVQAGSDLQLDRLRASLESLYATGEYSDIAVDAEEQNGELVLRFLTKPAYFVGSVLVEGVPGPPNTGQLEATTKLRLGETFTDPDISRAVENLQDLVRRNGFYNAVIRPHVDRNSNTQQASVRFVVEPGKRARFDGIILTGNPQLPKERIIRVTRWKGLRGHLNWQAVTEARVYGGVEAVRQSYRDKNYLLAKVELTKLEYHSDTNTVTPSIDIQPGPLVRVIIEGARLSKGKRRELLPIYQELAVDKDLLNEGVRSLTDYYESQGYFDVQVDYDQHSAPNGQQTIIYSIDRGSRHKLAALVIEGNHYFDLGTVRERMIVTPASALRYRYGRYSPKMLARDVESIRQLYQSNGFRNVEVASRVTVDDKSNGSNVAVYIDIKEGPQGFVSHFELTGAPASDLEVLKGRLHSSVGQPYSEANIAGDRDRLLEYFFNKGYPNATFEYQAQPAESSEQMDLAYHLNLGAQEFVRGVLVSGLVTTKPAFVDQKISLDAGDPLSLTQIAESQRRLNDLGIFASVQSAVQDPAGLEPNKYILFRTEEARKYSFNSAIGFQAGTISTPAVSLDSPAGAPGFTPVIALGINRINFMGLGRTVSLQTRFSTVEQLGNLSYLHPQFKGNPNLSLQVSSLYDRSHNVNTFDAQRVEAYVQLNQRTSRALSFQYRVFFRKVNIIGQPLISPELIPLLVQPVRVGGVATSLVYDRRDNILDPTRGTYSTVSVETTASFLGSQTDFVRIQGTNATYYQLGKNLIFARSTTFGANLRYGGFPEIPLAEHLFSGGANSMRAFPENQAGPRDLETGFPLGGNALLLNTVELRFPLFGDNFGGVLFNDLGNVYDDVDSISLRFRQKNIQDFNYGVQAFGFGIRYKTPVGPLRFDISLSPNAPRFYGYKGTYEQLLDGTGEKVNQRINIFQFHFSLGQTF